ncbi:MAG: hypothetical protein ACSLFP_16655, partial [Acidimicrobiales bacterium]
MTEGEQPARLDPALAERAAARRASAGKRGHAAAATRLFVGGAALAGTFQMVAAMGAPVAEVEALPTTVVNGTVPVAPTTTAPPPAPRTVVVVRRHVVVAGAPASSSVQSTRSVTPVA